MVVVVVVGVVVVVVVVGVVVVGVVVVGVVVVGVVARPLLLARAVASAALALDNRCGGKKDPRSHSMIALSTRFGTTTHST
jgi:hypothetical protein